MKETNFPLTIPLSLSILLMFPSLSSQSPEPTPWPPQFHSILVINSSKGLLQVNDLWYDWPNGFNLNIIQLQLGKKIYDMEWDNGTSYYYTLDENQECSTNHIPVGILRPNWLDAAEYVGQVVNDGFLCNVWKKVDFITYYEDVATKRPVSWVFYTGTVNHVMTFEVGKVLDEPDWQAPVYCFQENSSVTRSPFDHGSLMRQILPSVPLAI